MCVCVCVSLPISVSASFSSRVSSRSVFRVRNESRVAATGQHRHFDFISSSVFAALLETTWDSIQRVSEALFTSWMTGYRWCLPHSYWTFSLVAYHPRLALLLQMLIPNHHELLVAFLVDGHSLVVLDHFSLPLSIAIRSPQSNWEVDQYPLLMLNYPCSLCTDHQLFPSVDGYQMSSCPSSCPSSFPLTHAFINHSLSTWCS